MTLPQPSFYSPSTFTMPAISSDRRRRFVPVKVERRIADRRIADRH